MLTFTSTMPRAEVAVAAAPSLSPNPRAGGFEPFIFFILSLANKLQSKNIYTFEYTRVQSYLGIEKALLKPERFAKQNAP